MRCRLAGYEFVIPGEAGLSWFCVAGRKHSRRSYPRPGGWFFRLDLSLMLFEN
jgi:hypothetical protein